MLAHFAAHSSSFKLTLQHWVRAPSSFTRSSSVPSLRCRAEKHILPTYTPPSLCYLPIYHHSTLQINPIDNFVNIKPTSQALDHLTKTCRQNCTICYVRTEGILFCLSL